MKYLLLAIVFLNGSVAFGQLEKMLMVGQIDEADVQCTSAISNVKKSFEDVKKCYSEPVSVNELHGFINRINKNIAVAKLNIEKAKGAAEYVENKSREVECINAQKSAGEGSNKFLIAAEEFASIISVLSNAAKESEKETILEYLTVVIDGISSSVDHINSGIEDINASLNSIDACY